MENQKSIIKGNNKGIIHIAILLINNKKKLKQNYKLKINLKDELI